MSIRSMVLTAQNSAGSTLPPSIAGAYYACREVCFEVRNRRAVVPGSIALRGLHATLQAQLVGCSAPELMAARVSFHAGHQRSLSFTWRQCCCRPCFLHPTEVERVAHSSQVGHPVLQVSGLRELHFFPGQAVGPAFPGVLSCSGYWFQACLATSLPRCNPDHQQCHRCALLHPTRL